MHNYNIEIKEKKKSPETTDFLFRFRTGRVASISSASSFSASTKLKSSATVSSFCFSYLVQDYKLVWKYFPYNFHETKKRTIRESYLKPGKIIGKPLSIKMEAAEQKRSIFRHCWNRKNLPLISILFGNPYKVILYKKFDPKPWGINLIKRRE